MVNVAKTGLDIQRVRNATHFNRQHLREWIAAAERAFADLDRKAREEAQACRWCWYGRSTRIGGQAFTSRKCDACDVEQTFSSTSTDPLCTPCGVKLGLCVRCCADIDLVDRRKLERK
jgi:hypothetical protein